MREIEFRQLKTGDYVHDGNANQPWTVICPFPRHDTFLLVREKCRITVPKKWFWSVVVRLPDRACLAVADMLEIRIGRIFDPQKWAVEVGVN